jgi:hypothetical protein
MIYECPMESYLIQLKKAEEMMAEICRELREKYPDAVWVHDSILINE